MLHLVYSFIYSIKLFVYLNNWTRIRENRWEWKQAKRKLQWMMNHSSLTFWCYLSLIILFVLFNCFYFCICNRSHFYSGNLTEKVNILQRQTDSFNLVFPDAVPFYLYGNIRRRTFICHTDAFIHPTQNLLFVLFMEFFLILNRNPDLTGSS